MPNTSSVLDLVDAVYLMSILADQPRWIDRYIDYFGGGAGDLRGGKAGRSVASDARPRTPGRLRCLTVNDTQSPDLARAGAPRVDHRSANRAGGFKAPWSLSHAALLAEE